MLDKEELLRHLPSNLVKEIIFYTNKDYLMPIFQRYNSENMIKDICLVLKGQI